MPRLLKLDVRVTPEELARYHELAKSRQMSVSRLVRKVLDTLAQDAPVQNPASQQQAGPVKTDLNTHVPSETRELVGTTTPTFSDEEVANYTAEFEEKAFWLMPEDKKQEWRESYRMYREAEF